MLVSSNSSLRTNEYYVDREKGQRAESHGRIRLGLGNFIVWMTPDEALAIARDLTAMSARFIHEQEAERHR